MATDPHDQTPAPDEQDDAPDGQHAGEQTLGRAELLGSTALTVRVRCTCGKRQDLDREDWQWFGVAACTRCGRGILDHSLHVVSAEQAREMIEGRRPTEGELRALRRMELSLRDFLPRYDEQPRWVWSSQTVRLAEEIRHLLSDLDDSRRGRGAPPVVARQAARDDATEEGEWDEGGRHEGDDDEDFGDEEDAGGDTAAGDDE